MSEPLDRTVTANVLKIIRATDLPPLPGDGSEPLDVAMRYVVLWQADEIERLGNAILQMREAYAQELSRRIDAEAAKGGEG